MPLIAPEFGAVFYALSLLVSGGLFFWFRRLYRRLANEAAALAATVLSAVLATPFVLLALAWLVHLITRS